MGFLIVLRQDWATLRGRPGLEELVAVERRVGARLIQEGARIHIRRLPGQRANVGIWKAPDPTAPIARLDRLPLRAWLEVDVPALAAHDLEPLAGPQPPSFEMSQAAEDNASVQVPDLEAGAL